MMTPQCFGCKHVNRAGQPMRCTAYPGGIPRAILVNDHDHREPYEGDHGILFESVEPDKATG